MEERKFKVLIDETVVANNMNLDTATILVKALFEEYYNDHTMIVSIKEEDRCICLCEEYNQVEEDLKCFK